MKSIAMNRPAAPRLCWMAVLRVFPPQGSYQISFHAYSGKVSKTNAPKRTVKRTSLMF